MSIQAIINSLLTRFRYFYTLLWVTVGSSAFLTLWGAHFIFQDNPRPWLGLLIAIPSGFFCFMTGLLLFYGSKLLAVIEPNLEALHKFSTRQEQDIPYEKDITAQAAHRPVSSKREKQDRSQLSGNYLPLIRKE